MNKKSNIIVGLSVVAVVFLLVGGMMVFSKSRAGDQKSATAQAVKSVNLTQSGEQKMAPSEISGSDQASSTAGGSVSGGSFVASKQGKKYFPVNCGSAKTIKEENRVYFGSEVEAQQAGYERTATCK
jgi:hypothetical protein